MEPEEEELYAIGESYRDEEGRVWILKEHGTQGNRSSGAHPRGGGSSKDDKPSKPDEPGATQRPGKSKGRDDPPDDSSSDESDSDDSSDSSTGGRGGGDDSRRGDRRKGGGPPDGGGGGGSGGEGEGRRKKSKKKRSSAKLREQNEMKVPKFPNVSTLTPFRMELYDRAMICAQDKKYEKVVKWLQVAEKEGIKMDEIPKPKRKFETLDRKMALALHAILPRDLEMRVNTDKAKALEKGELLSGRQILWHIYRHFQTSPNQTRIYNMTDLFNIFWFGDKSKEKFLTFWNDRMAQLSGNVEDWMKAEVLYRALMSSDDLKIDMMAYRSKYPTNVGEELGRERYDAMMDILHRRVVMEREEVNRMERETRDRRFVERFAKSSDMALPASTKGGVKKGKGKNRSQSSKGKGENKEGKKGKSRSKSAKGGRKGKVNKSEAEEKGLCVNWVVSGSCVRGAECRYRHERPTSDADEKYYRELHTRISSRSKSPAPKGKGKGVCRQWQTDGSCRFGTECRYKHDEGAAAPATKAQGRSSSRGSSRGRKKKTSAAVPVTNGSSQPSVAGGAS